MRSTQRQLVPTTSHQKAPYLRTLSNLLLDILNLNSETLSTMSQSVMSQSIMSQSIMSQSIITNNQSAKYSTKVKTHM